MDSRITKYLKAEIEAWKKEDKEVGTIEFTCPLCGNKAISNRYYFGGRIHGLGSGCKHCNITHS